MREIIGETDIVAAIAAESFQVLHLRWVEQCSGDPEAAAGSLLHDAVNEAARDLATLRPTTLAGWKCLARAAATWSRSGVDDLALAVVANLAASARDQAASDPAEDQ